LRAETLRSGLVAVGKIGKRRVLSGKVHGRAMARAYQLCP
jgi:hypothetical protein